MTAANNPESFHSGYDAMIEKIQSIGWAACRDEFNIANPPGQKWTGSSAGLAYAQGEFQALSDWMGQKCIGGEVEV